METHINVDSAIPGAPAGILGRFIQYKLAAYVEPSRAGTPKGEVIGLSRKKFHAVLLAMTNIDLRKQAKVIRTSYGLLRKWRTEDVFVDALEALVTEFIDQHYVPNCKTALVIMIARRAKMAKFTIHDSLDRAAIESGKVSPSFGDIGLYGRVLHMNMEHKFNYSVNLAAQQKEAIEAALDLSVPLIYYYRTWEPELHALAQKALVASMVYLHKLVGGAFYEHDKDQCIFLMSDIAMLIHETVRP